MKFGHPKKSENGSAAENEAQRESRQVIFSKMASLLAILLIYAHASLATTLNRLRDVVVERLKAERRKKNTKNGDFRYRTLLRLAVFRVAFGHLYYESC